MKLKKILYSILFFLFFQSNCIALCLTDKVDFGDSLSVVGEKLKIPPLTKKIQGKEGDELGVPGPVVCSDKVFEGSSLAYIFFEDQLAQIVGYKLTSTKLDLLDWLEKEFGKVKKTIKGLDTSAKGAEFVWDKDILFIFYAMRRSEDETMQHFEITSKRYEKLIKGYEDE